MEISPNKPIVAYFYHWETTKPKSIYLRQPFGDEYRDFSWEEVGNQARRIAAYLKARNLPPQSNIGMVSKNCAEWIITDLAIMMAGHVSVPFYPTLTGEQLNQVLTHSECKYLFVGKLDDWQEMKTGIPTDVQCISFPTYNPDPTHLQWNDLLKQYEPIAGQPLPKLEDLYTIIYTSGTTGNPKGVMITVKALAEGTYHTREAARLDIKDARFFSYLPLCHVAERNIVESASLITGGTIFFAESLDTFAKNVQAADPTHFLAVPRIWAKFQQTILSKMPQKKLDLYLKIPIFNTIVKNKIKAGLGLTNAEVILTGAAPMPVSITRWFRKLGIIIQEAYGMTENLGAVTMMPKHHVKDGTVGQLYPTMEVHIAEDTGEILTRSGWNMTGYYKEPKVTAETIDADGWIHTGDVGELDAENYLTITGRVKEMYKTAKGEYIAPAQIEMGFADNTFIEQICVVGQHLPQPIALVVLSESGKSVPREEAEQSLTNTLNALNPKLKTYERMNKIVILNEPWTVENNMLTPTMKLKRNIIEKKYDPKLDKWYHTKGTVIYE